MPHCLPVPLFSKRCAVLEKTQLLGAEFEDVSWTLKHLALSDSDQEALAKTIKSIDIQPVETTAKIAAILAD